MSNTLVTTAPSNLTDLIIAISLSELNVIGSLSGLADRISGGRGGIILAAMAQIEATGVNIAQLKNVGSALVDYVTQNADPQLAKEVFDAIPGLREHLAH